MIPLSDIHKPKRPPFITRLLLTLNLAVFLYQCFNALTGNAEDLIKVMGVKPRCYFSPSSCGISLPSESELLWQPLFVSPFLHGGILHVALNMLFLWVFGPGVEERLGRWRFTLFYLGCGIAASAVHILTHPLSYIPTVGASGAIAGVLGIYLILLPRSWILTYFPPIFLFPVPAPLFLIAWIFFQIVNSLAHLPGLSARQPETDIAWMAHVGGFGVGLGIGWLSRPGAKSRRKSKPKTTG